MLLFVSFVCIPFVCAPSKIKRQLENPEIPGRHSRRKEAEIVSKTRLEELEEASVWLTEAVGKRVVTITELTLARINFEQAQKALNREQEELEVREKMAKAAYEVMSPRNENDRNLLQIIHNAASEAVKNELSNFTLSPVRIIEFCSHFDPSHISEEHLASAIVKLQCGVASVTDYTGDYLRGFCKVDAGRHNSRVFFSRNSDSNILTIHFAGPKSEAPETSKDKSNSLFIKAHTACFK